MIWYPHALIYGETFFSFLHLLCVKWNKLLKHISSVCNMKYYNIYLHSMKCKCSSRFINLGNPCLPRRRHARRDNQKFIHVTNLKDDGDDNATQVSATTRASRHSTALHNFYRHHIIWSKRYSINWLGSKISIYCVKFECIFIFESAYEDKWLHERCSQVVCPRLQW